MLFLLLASACAEDPPPAPQNFPQLHYEYLRKLRLDVGSIDIEDRSHPLGPNDVAGRSPAVPAQALAQMARDRLFAAGAAGSAVFVIDQASILQSPGGGLDGRLSVHLDIVKPDGSPGGYASAEVLRQHVPGSDPEDEAAQLYDLTRRMLEAMNVELEFQLKHSLASLLVTGAPTPAPVQAQPLDAPPVNGPGASPQAAPDASQAPPPVPPPPGNGYLDPEAPPPPQERSPPPGVLQLPPGVLP